MRVRRERGIYHEGLAPVVMQAGQAQVGSVHRLPGDRGELVVQSVRGLQPWDLGEPRGPANSGGGLQGSSLLFRETGLSALCRPSPDWTRPTHIIKGRQFAYSESTELDVHFIQNTL